MKSRHCAAVCGTILLAGMLPVQAQTSANTTANRPVAAAKTSSAPGAKTRKSAATTDTKASASYSLGVSFGTQLHGTYGLNSDAVVYDRLLQGLKDAMSGKVVAGQEDSARIQAMITQIRATEGATNETAAAKFLAENAKQPGVMTTADGLQYKIIRPGTGSVPKPTDEVTVNYRGTLLNGTEFDSSYRPGRTAFTTPLSANLIKGWTEGLLLMKPGSKYEFFIPPALAYGEQSPPPIPPNSLLKFEVELMSVKPAAASSAPHAMTAPKHP